MLLKLRIEILKLVGSGVQMIVGKSNKKIEVESNFFANPADTQMVSRMRMVLAVSVLLAVFIDPSGLSAVKGFTWLVFFGYFIHSIIVYIHFQFNGSFSQGVLVHRLDVLWFALIVIFTGGIDSFFFLFFFFAILTSSFKWGFEEGARVTIASAFLFAVSGFLMLDEKNDLSRLLLRTTFLLVIGYMSVHWGESKVRLMRQLALLRDVTRLSNPRFGVDHTIASMLEKTRLFYKASSCVLVMRNNESGVYSVRTIKEGDTSSSMQSTVVDTEVALPLMGTLHHHLMVYTRALWPAMSSWVQESLIYDNTDQDWQKEQGHNGKRLADLLEARSFISAPISLIRQEGRIYVISGEKLFGKSDAEFLSHISEQVFPVIENIELLDKMASQAALQERHKISLDIHDATIQPYIGLKLGLSGLRMKATADNPIVSDIDKLMHMADKVIDDLRRYAVTFRTDAAPSEPILLVMLNQQAAQFREFYGIDISITMARELMVSDRLATEVLQLVREGLSNICKHTVAQKGSVNLHCLNNLLVVQIKNEHLGMQPVIFLPRSISERTTRLGGTVHVNRGPGGNTVVNVEIPI